MDSVEKVLQVVSKMESRVEAQDVDTLDHLLSGLEQEGKGHTASYVKMMRAIGRYLADKGLNAHPDTVPVLASLAADLEILAGKPSPEEAGEILARGVRSFKDLKARAAAPHVSEKDMEALKAVVLAVDWEISAVTLRSFDRVLTRLKEKVRSSRIHFSFLRIIHAIGGDIARRKADAHNDSINLLRSVLRNFELLVRYPDMAPDRKKELIEGDIRAYNALKQDIRPKPDISPAAADEDVAPALSHVPSAPSAGEPVPLSTLPEPVGETIAVRAGRQREKKGTPPGDVMGDLFSPKASPADELLDAIHLAEVHGGNRAAGVMVDNGVQETGEGIRNLTPRRVDSAPIPEIESRLDAFFSQDFSPPVDVREPEGDQSPEEGQGPEKDREPEAPAFIDAELVQMPEVTAELISDRAAGGEADAEVTADAGAVRPVMERLAAALASPGDLKRETVFTKVLEDLYHLKQLWPDAPDKSSLLTLLAGLSHYIHDTETPDTEEKAPGETDPEGQEPEDNPDPAQAGIFAKVKSMFRNKHDRIL
ncbi:MAG: hypothetical protein MI863_24500 [Desulfobacterales bacterium]|nr:hypothetical protein [Desulfobacterales bacterium]